MKQDPSEESEPVLLGIPADPADQMAMGLSWYEPPPGSRLAPCLVCGKPCWLGPKQQEALTRGIRKVGCALCLAKAQASGAKVGPVQDLGGKSGTFHPL